MKETVGANLNQIVNFALRCADVDDFEPELDWIKEIVGLLSDIANLIDANHRSMLDHWIIEDMVAHLWN